MIRATVLLSVLLIVNLRMILKEESFENNQMKYERVRAAVEQKESGLKDLCRNQQIQYPPQELFMRAFKEEKELELWARDDQRAAFVRLKTYPVCALSGKLGPKRKEGDLQIPEGFYQIDQFNPISKYHLSMRLNYPNASDKILGHKKSPGGDIFIHGDCMTVGCLPMTDNLIKELYVISLKVVSDYGNPIRVHIFPTRMDTPRYRRLVAKHRDDEDLIGFWDNLKDGFDLFESGNVPADVVVDEQGRYRFTQKEKR